MRNHIYIFFKICGSNNYHSSNYGKACSDSIVKVATIAIVVGKLAAILNINFKEK
jgi:hypothetical protein